MEKFSEKQFDKVGHTLGINVCHAKNSKDKNDKVLPDKFYRNYFCYGQINVTTPEWVESLSKYIDKWQQYGSMYFQINDKGIELFRTQFKEEITDKHVPLTRSKQKYLDYVNADLGISFAEYLGIRKS